MAQKKKKAERRHQGDTGARQTQRKWESRTYRIKEFFLKKKEKGKINRNRLIKLKELVGQLKPNIHD